MGEFKHLFVDISDKLSNKSLHISIFLISKTEKISQNFEIFNFDLTWKLKKQSQREQFEDLNVLLNDNLKTFVENLKIIQKLLLNFCFLSPFVNFF